MLVPWFIVIAGGIAEGSDHALEVVGIFAANVLLYQRHSTRPDDQAVRVQYS